MDMIKMAGTDSSSGSLQRTVIKLSVRPGEAEQFEMERTGWVDWKEIFCSWMVTNSSLEKFRPEHVQCPLDGGEEVTCLQISGTHLVMGLTSGARSEHEIVSGESNSSNVWAWSLSQSLSLSCLSHFSTLS